MNAICPASQLAHLTCLVPEVGHGWLASLRPGAFVLRCMYWLRTRDCLKRAFRAEAALWMNAIGLASQHAICALWVPVERNGWQVVELAHLGTRTMDVLKAARAAEATVRMLAVGVAPMLAHVTGGIPEVPSRGLHVEGTLCCPSMHGSFWASDTCERVIAAKAALLMHSVSPTSKLSDFALGVPIIGDVGLVLETATAGRARDVDEIASATEAALDVLPIGIATEVTHLARRIPERAHIDRVAVKIAMAQCLGTAIHAIARNIKLASAASDASRTTNANQLEAISEPGAHSRWRSPISRSCVVLAHQFVAARTDLWTIRPPSPTSATIRPTSRWIWANTDVRCVALRCHELGGGLLFGPSQTSRAAHGQHDYATESQHLN